jgi:hypothetical protein
LSTLLPFIILYKKLHEKCTIKLLEVKNKEEVLVLETLMLTECLDQLADFATSLFPK